MDWFPNEDAAEFFATRVLPQVRTLRPRARFRIAGRCRSDEFLRRMARTAGIEMTGFVEDMRRELERAPVCVVPLRIASGTRLKILEAAAMRRAIVATAAGAEGLDFTPGSEIVIADDPERMALAVAATRALDGLSVAPTHALIDGSFNFLRAPLDVGLNVEPPPNLTYAQLSVTTLVGGDRCSAVIAAAYARPSSES